jgi:hypothetical protein
MEDITIIVASLYGQREELTSDFRTKGYSVAVHHYSVPAGYLPSWDEVVAVFIGSSVATALIGNIVTDAYNTIKTYVRERLKKPEVDDKQRYVVVFYSADRQTIEWWVISKELEEKRGEFHADTHRIWIMYKEQDYREDP